ncbi:MAG: hypothetical protein KC502_18050 [Myxococcales bacterium]|nr:hypothetical protein [Myxococcales bacterium]
MSDAWLNGIDPKGGRSGLLAARVLCALCLCLWAGACSDDPEAAATDATAADAQSNDGVSVDGQGDVASAGDALLQDVAITADGGGATLADADDSDGGLDDAHAAVADTLITDAASAGDAGGAAGDAAGTGADTGATQNSDAAAGTADGAADAGTSGGDAGAGSCTPTSAFNYSCDAKKPATCPGGSCLFGLCVGPKLDQDRWKLCGNQQCDPCESSQSCPADCGGLPKMSGKLDFTGKKTLTVWVHGFTNKSPAELKKLTFGSVKGCGDLHKQMQLFGATIPCGATSPGDKAPDQFVAVEYYGDQTPTWMSAKDIKQVQAYPVTAGAKGLIRYALVVAKFIRWRMKLTGATHVNLACHSMGCLIIRHLWENNMEGLAAERRLVRWYSNTGVIAGARLARLYDNPTIQQGAKSIGLELGDFVLMNPDNVMDVTAWWDHKLSAGNNPLFAGALLHHTIATDPKIAQALNIQLLDLNNPGDEPNDGIMYSLDQYFHSQHPAARATTKTGTKLMSSRSWAYFDHMTNPESAAVGVLGVAALYHRRKVVVTLEEVTLKSDHEKDNLLDLANTGEPPAEIAVEVAVSYPTKKLKGKPVLLSEQRVAHRSAEMFSQAEKSTKKPKLLIYSGPIFDGQKELSLALKLLEVDWYPRFKVGEWLLKPHTTLLAIDKALPLTNKSHAFTSGNVAIKVSVAVHEMY